MKWLHRTETPIHDEAFFTDPEAPIGALVVKKIEGWEAWAWWPKQDQFKVGECYKTATSAKQAAIGAIQKHSPLNRRTA